MIPIEINNIFKGSKISSFDPYFEECFEYADINSNARLSMFFAQTGIESGYYTRFVENLNYSAQRLADVFPAKFSVNKAAKIKVPNPLAISIANKPELIGNALYDNRMGNKKGQGYLYRGRGIIQLTGFYNYNAFNNDMGTYLGSNFVNHPNTLLEFRNSLYAASCFWKEKKLNLYADRKDIKGSTKVINGGLHGLKERTELYNKIFKMLG